MAQRQGDPQSRRAWGTMCGGGLQGLRFASAVPGYCMCLAAQERPFYLAKQQAEGAGLLGPGKVKF